MSPSVQRDGTAAEVRDLLKSRMQVMRDALSQVPGVVLHSAGAGMFVVADIRALGVDGREFAQGLLDQHDVAVLPCDGFGESGAGLLRISLCEPEQRLRDACSRLATYVADRGWRRKRNEPLKAGARRRPFSGSVNEEENNRR